MSIVGVDGKIRCFGGQINKEFYGDYHDHEWGVPVHDDRHLFEMLILEGAQAGLSWETVLKRRRAYNQVFHNFDPIKVSNMKDNELEALRTNDTIIRNRLKIFSTRQNALCFLTIQKEFGSFDHYLWSYVKGQPIINHRMHIKEIPTSTSESIALSNDLQKRGMTFVGPTIIYAYMQAVGMVNDHLIPCWRHGH